MRNATRLGVVIALSTSSLLGACGGGKGDAGANGGASTTASADAAPGTGSSGATSGNTGATPPGAPAGAGGATTPGDSVKSPNAGTTARMTDPEIVSLTQAADEGEIMTSKVALTKATNPEVKKFAQQMIQAHTQTISKRNAIGKAQNLKPAAGAKDSIGDMGKQMVAMLQAAPKAAFDTAYINGQVMSHQNTLQMVQKAEGQAQNAALKQMLQQVTPDIQHHLDEAKALQGKLGGGAGGAGASGAAAPAAGAAQ